MTISSGNQWVDRFANHTVHATLPKLREAIAGSGERASADLAATNALARIEIMVALASDLLASADPQLVSATTLDNLHNLAAAAATEVRNYSSNGNVGHLSNANAQVDQTLTFLAQVSFSLPRGNIRISRDPEASAAPGQADSLAVLQSSAAAYLNSVRGAAEAASADVEKLRGSVRALESLINTQNDRVTAAVGGFQAQFSTAEAQRAAQFSTAESGRQSQWTTFVDEQKRGIERDISGQLELLRGALEAFGVTRDEFVSHQEEALHSLRSVQGAFMNELRASGEKALEALADQQKKAEKIVHVVGNTGMVGGYQLTANQEASSAWWWSAAAVVAMLMLIAGAIASLRLAPDELKWSYVVLRITPAMATVVLASYAAKRASLHREESRALRRTELELASIDPYLALLPEDQRHAVKKVLAERYFGQVVAQPAAPVASVSPLPAELLRSSLDTAKSAFDATKAVAESKKA